MGAALVAAPFLAQSGLSIFGASQNAAALRQQGEFEKKQGEINERLANNQADDAIARGDTESAAYQKQVKQLIGKERVALAAQGVDVNEGSAADVQTDTAEIGALDALTIRNNAKREAFGFKIAASNASLQGTMAQASANNQARATVLTGGISALGSFAEGVSKYREYK